VRGAAEAAGRGRNADVNAYVGMIVFLGTWVMLFAALFFAYGVVRVQAPSWPPPTEPPLPRGVPGLNTLVLIASSLVLRRGIAAGEGRRMGRALAAAIGLGSVFLAVQIATWTVMAGRGLVPSSGIYGSVFFALTGFHALHVAVGLLALTVVAVRARTPSNRALRAVRITALFWDFIAVVWVLMYLAVYVA
jgi:cytochrome c oxidase subunit 3